MILLLCFYFVFLPLKKNLCLYLGAAIIIIKKKEVACSQNIISCLYPLACFNLSPEIFPIPNASEMFAKVSSLIFHLGVLKSQCIH